LASIWMWLARIEISGKVWRIIIMRDFFMAQRKPILTHVFHFYNKNFKLFKPSSYIINNWRTFLLHSNHNNSYTNR
jgi:hypothetical protein